MAKFRLPVNNFLLGEVSSKFYGRYDIREISQACRSLLNSIVRPQGGSFRRPGSRHITNQIMSVTTSGNVRLIPWIISKTEAYVVAVGTGPNTYTAGEYIARSAAWPAEAIAIYRLADDTWYGGRHIGLFGAGSPAAIAGDTWVAYTTAQLKELQYSQFNDVMIITHGGHYPITIRRISSTSFFYHGPQSLWELADSGGSGLFEPQMPSLTQDKLFIGIPYSDRNTNTAHTLQISATTGTGRTLTSSLSLFTANHVGAKFKLFDPGSGTEGVCLVTAVTSGLIATVAILTGAPMGSTAATNAWSESAWSNARGWPRSVGFHQNRTVYGGNTSYPNTLWFSQLDDIYELIRPSTGATDNDAYSAIISTGKLNEIQWIAPGKTLIVGTGGEEIIVEGTDANEALSNSNFSAVPETGFGSEYVKPVRIDNALLFVQRTGQKIREFQFNFQENAYNSRDLNKYADHIGLKAYDYYASVTVPKFIQLEQLNGDNPVTCALDNNGVLNFLVRDKESTAIAWCPIKLGGKFGSGSEPPVILSMCVVPSYSGLDDELWLYVKRTINSSTVYFFERITREFFGTTLAQASAPNSHFYPYYLDCAINQTLGAPGTSFNGFTRMNGDTVHVIADGNYIGTKVVGALVANTITLTSNATTITAGYTYQSVISPILPDMGSQIGNSIGAVRRITDMAIRFRRTVAAKFGRSTSTSDLESIVFRPASVSTSLPIPLFDGVKRRSFNGEYDRDPQIYIIQDDPLPMEVCSFSADGVTYD